MAQTLVIRTLSGEEPAVFPIGITPREVLLDRVAKRFKVKTVDRVRVFASEEDAENTNHDGTSVADLIGILADPVTPDSVLISAGFAFEEDGKTLAVFGRVEEGDVEAPAAPPEKVNNKSGK